MNFIRAVINTSSNVETGPDWLEGENFLIRLAGPVFKGKLNSCCQTRAAAAKSLQLCPTLCDPIDGSPPGSPVPGILEDCNWCMLGFLGRYFP